MKSKYQKIKGTFDILPTDTRLWKEMENILHNISQQFSYEEIRTPSIESIDLFKQNVGYETDVSKEMFTWEDLSNQQIALKPEMTAPVVRAYIEGGLYRSNPLCRLYYIDSLFRREKPQKGRQRQFNQFGIEAFGSSNIEQDVEVIMIAATCLKTLNINETTLHVNNIGSPETRTQYEGLLKKYFTQNIGVLSSLSKKRLETNPIRILDSKEQEDQSIIKNAPIIKELLTDSEKEDFNMLLSNLDTLNIKYEESPYLVRGLDYYNGTTFEITTRSNKSQNALCGGGRYDFLVEQMGGPSTPAIGFAAGMERMIIESQYQVEKNSIDIYISSNDLNHSRKCFTVMQNLINNNYTVFFDTNKKNVKNQMKDATKRNASYLLIIDKKITVKNIKSNDEIAVSDFHELLNFLKNQ
ncbi:MAG: histidine--tRNA ligase [Candidatus Marinimicrobia bacterium]|nr:histidine--tRNA ligase [Candidatus Neomarinimicrobiota bacterium]MDG1900148.1 histidine--tRNA ligase [Candidatus Neomarinimicrobiota bacterium]